MLQMLTTPQTSGGRPQQVFICLGPVPPRRSARVQRAAECLHGAARKSLPHSEPPRRQGGERSRQDGIGGTRCMPRQASRRCPRGVHGTCFLWCFALSPQALGERLVRLEGKSPRRLEERVQRAAECLERDAAARMAVPPPLPPSLPPSLHPPSNQRKTLSLKCPSKKWFAILPGPVLVQCWSQ